MEPEPEPKLRNFFGSGSGSSQKGRLRAAPAPAPKHWFFPTLGVSTEFVTFPPRNNSADLAYLNLSVFLYNKVHFPPFSILDYQQWFKRGLPSTLSISTIFIHHLKFRNISIYLSIVDDGGRCPVRTTTWTTGSGTNRRGRSS